MIKISLDMSGPEELLRKMEARAKKLAEVAAREQMIEGMDEARRQLGLPPKEAVLRKRASVMYRTEDDARKAMKNPEDAVSMADAHQFARDLEAWLVGRR